MNVRAINGINRTVKWINRAVKWIKKAVKWINRPLKWTNRAVKWMSDNTMGKQSSKMNVRQYNGVNRAVNRAVKVNKQSSTNE